MAFGRTVADAMDNESWILGFKDGTTRIRICQELPTWIKYQHHFHSAAYYFPCKNEEDCVGCIYSENFNDDGSPKRPYQYAFNALDEKGVKHIYRLGTDAFKILKSRHQRLGTLTDRDYNIVREGKGFDTTYIPEPGDKYEIDLPEDLIDIMEALAKKYAEAEKLILAKVREEKEEAQAASDDPAVKPAAKKNDDEPKVAGPLKVKDSGTDESAAVARAVQADLGGEASFVDTNFEDFGTPDLKKFLTDRKVEVPPRAGRAALITLCEESKDLPPF